MYNLCMWPFSIVMVPFANSSEKRVTNACAFLSSVLCSSDRDIDGFTFIVMVLVL